MKQRGCCSGPDMYLAYLRLQRAQIWSPEVPKGPLVFEESL
eukprot:01343.XXX_1897_2016_1 [CDS] Oithona nana genome sequencing.